MKIAINDRELDFICSHGSMGRERGVSIAKEDIAEDWLMDAVATTTRDIRRKYLATAKGNYAVVRQYANLFPYERAVITFFEKDMGSQALEKEIRTFNEIRYGEHLFKLMVPITAEAELSTEGWILYHEDLSILAVAPTMEECIDGFQEYFYVLWEEYANKKDDELTDSGQVLKHKLLDIIKE